MSERWSINGRFLTQPVSGVQRYGREILRELDTLANESHRLTHGLEMELLVPPGGTDMPRLEAIPVRQIGRSRGHVWEQTALSRHASGGLLSLCNTGPIAHPRQIVCIHDVNTRAVPGSYAPAFRALYRILHPLLGRRAARVATVSQYSAGELARYGIAPKGKLMVVPNGHEHAKRWPAAHSPATRPLADGRSVVAIGSPAPHKNVALLLNIADALAKAGIRLVIAGVSDSRVFTDSLGAGEADNVVWLGRLSDGEIAALLRDALCLAFPSYAEGFGLPLLEAMTMGCPVVASDRSSLPEVGGDAALYAAPDDPHAWCDLIIHLARTPALRRDLVAKGYHRAYRYSWRAGALAYLEEMRTLDGEPGTAGRPSVVPAAEPGPGG